MTVDFAARSIGRPDTQLLIRKAVEVLPKDERQQRILEKISTGYFCRKCYVDAVLLLKLNKVQEI